MENESLVQDLLHEHPLSIFRNNQKTKLGKITKKIVFFYVEDLYV